MYTSGYYRVLQDGDDYKMKQGFCKGAMAYVVVGAEQLDVLIGDSHWIYHCHEGEDLQEFADTFEFEPNGMEIRQGEMAALMQEIQDTDSLTAAMQKQLSNFTPAVSDSGDLTETGSELAPVSDMNQVKLVVATSRNTLVKTKKELKAKTDRLAMMLKEQSSILALKTKELEALLAKAEEAIWSINLYLGKNEDIHVLRTGKPAPEDQKIVLRQQVLYMDEECAIASRTEGIDIHSVEQFDRWLLESPAHLNQVLYETKAVVALHVKRYAKKYGDDAWRDSEINNANLHWTYFLVRNGENLYRVFIDLDAGEYMFPTTDSLTNVFSKSKPGSREYMESIKRAEESHRHYLRVLLVLQGLLDRTPIFKPMPLSRINLCDPGQSYDYVEFIYDAERQLTDGRPLFDEWLGDLNSQLEVGHRVIGVFDYRSGVSGSRDNGTDSRIFPTSASRPGDKILHTIEKEEDGHFIFRYERKEDRIYRRGYGSHAPKNRASCWVEKDDNFFLNFDAVELKDLEYYATHRQSRHMYRDMIALLEAAIKLKKRETADEEPFRKLLVGALMKDYKISFETAEEEVPGLIRWWKFKNRSHRALLSDDLLAFNMIVKEYGLRVKNAATNKGMHQAVLTEAMQYDPLMVAHKKDNVYVVYFAHNDQNIWVIEQEWKFNRSSGSVVCVEEHPWQTVDKRHWRWDILHKSNRWKEWRINPFKNKVLTDPEIEQVVEQGVGQLQKTKGKKSGDRLLPLCVTCNDQFEIGIWFSDEGPEVPELLHSERIEEAKVRKWELAWTKKGAKVTVETYYSYRYSSSYSFTDEHMPWEGTSRYPAKDHVLQLWAENIETLREEYRLVEAAKKREKEIERRYSYVTRTVTEQIYQERVSEARWEFFQEHGDPELWDDHLKDLKITKPSFGVLEEALKWYSERNESPVGQTAAQVLAQATAWGMGGEKRNSWQPDYTIVPKNLPLDWVVPPVPGSSEEDDDD